MKKKTKNKLIGWLLLSPMISLMTGLMVYLFLKDPIEGLKVIGVFLGLVALAYISGVGVRYLEK